MNVSSDLVAGGGRKIITSQFLSEFASLICLRRVRIAIMKTKRIKMICKKCGKDKPENEFYPEYGYRIRKLQTQCKECMRKKTREYSERKKNEIKLAIYQR
jgi:hypothetical protein